MLNQKLKKKVTWAPDVKLRQVKLFLSEDSPSQVGLGAQDHLQAKASWLVHSSGAGFDEHLPPGFEGTSSSDQSEIELRKIHLIKWKTPPKFVPTSHWRVVDGEESQEAEIQKKREMRVLEAVYPRPSSIPPNPSFPPVLEDSRYDDDRCISVIPITPIEDEDVIDPSLDTMASSSSHFPPLPQSLLGSGTMQPSHSSNICSIPEAPRNEKPAVGTVPGVGPDIVAAASVAFTAIMRSNEQGSLVDPELLIKILSNPNLIEKLVTDYAAPGSTQSAPQPSSAPLISTHSSQFPTYPNRIEPKHSLSTAPNAGHFQPVTNVLASTLHPPPHGFSQPPPPSVKAPPVKDINYYKSLIQQHGEEKADSQDQTLPQFGQDQALPQFGNHLNNYHPAGPKTELLHGPQPRDTKPKMKKPCIYFNSSRGCKHGANCIFQHDASVQQRIGNLPEAQSAKRMKIDNREITGRS